MWRWMVLLLVLANGLFWLWGHGQLRDFGLGPEDVAEPARLKNQLRPDALEVKPPAPAPTPPAAANAAAPAAQANAATPTPVAPSTPATPPVQAPTVKGK